MFNYLVRVVQENRAKEKAKLIERTIEEIMRSKLTSSIKHELIEDIKQEVK